MAWVYIKQTAAALALCGIQTAAAQTTPTAPADTSGADGRRESATKPPAPFAVFGYAEIYYGYDFTRPANNTRPSFVYSHNRHNEVTANLVFLKGAYTTASLRVSVALMAGTYSNANLAAEPGVLKNIFEAYAGLKISRAREIWLDAGIMPAHLGFESAVAQDCWTLTRSLSADNSPYYISGLKLGYTTPGKKWFAALLLLNGWQRIQRPDGYGAPALGTQLTFKPGKNATLNWSTFAGSDKPDSLHRPRIYHNLYGIFPISDRFGLTAGFDYGMERAGTGAGQWYRWYVPTIILRCKTSAKTALAVRGEYFSDPDGVVISDDVGRGFATAGASLNFDYRPMENALIRVEGKSFFSSEPVYPQRDGTRIASSPCLTASFSVAF